jgi:4-hydroxy-tetrahydrodipicolinate reductase
LTLIFIASLDNPEDQDTIRIEGVPDLTITLTGTNGDIATSAIAVNAIHRVRESAPGLVTMRDLPIITIG